MLIILFSKGIIRSLIHPLFIYCAYTVYVYQYIDDRMNVNAFETNSIILISFMITFLFYLFFYLMKFPKLNKFFHSNTDILPYSFIMKSDRKVWYIGMTLVVIFIIINLWFYAKSLGSFEIALLRFYSRFSDIEIFKERTQTGLIFIVLDLFSKLSVSFLGFLRIAYHFRKINIISFWITFILILINGFSSGSRGMIVLPVLFILFIDLIFFIKGRTKAIIKTDSIFSFIIVIILFIVLGHIRNVQFDNFNDFIKYIKTENWIALVQNDTDQKKYDREYNIHYINHCLSTYPEKAPFLNFHTFFTLIVNPIPRSIWPDKPIGFGRILALHNLGILNPDAKQINLSSASFSAGISGEGYANFGLIGVTIFSAIFGAISGIFAKLSKTLIYSNSAMSLIIGILLLKGSFSFVRGAMLDNLFQTIYPVTLLFIISVISKHIKKPS